MMPKLSVYVADDLWEQAREVAQGKPASTVVQLALRDYVANGTARPSFARQRPEASSNWVAQARERLASQARERYERGFEEGIELTNQLSWGDLDQLAGLKWDLNRWWNLAEATGRVSVEDDGDQSFRYYKDNDADAKRAAQAIGKVLDNGFIYQAVYRRGVTDALMDVWKSISTAEGETDADDEEITVRG